jgi:Uncharacterized protein conserved in bacteria
VGGLKVEGSYVEPNFFSFVSEFRIPYVYGLTVGELANLINEEGLNRGVDGKEAPLKCRLTVIPMRGWERSMLYKDTGLPWILPSPNIPSEASAIGYPSAGIAGEFGYLNIGVGYTIPFPDLRRPLDRRGQAEGETGQLQHPRHRLSDHPLQAHFGQFVHAARGTIFLYGLRIRNNFSDAILRHAGRSGAISGRNPYKTLRQDQNARYRLWHGLCEEGIRKAPESRRYRVLVDERCRGFQGTIKKLLLISLTFKTREP